MTRAPFPFHVMTKPTGPLCNLNCDYCFYLEKQGFFPRGHAFRMSDAVLERYIRDYIGSQPTPEVTFAWQGGEPTLLGLPFFEKVIELQKRHADGRRIDNTLQTNGTFLDDAWGEFLHRNGFLVGISIDGPPHLHDTYRRDRKGGPSSAEVLRGLEILKKHRVEFNTLTVVNRQNARWPLVVYRYLKKIGSRYMQFIPAVERAGEESGSLAGPPDPETAGEEVARVTPWSVRPVDYGSFLVSIFREWVRRDVGSVFVQSFDVALAAWVGAPPGVCVAAPNCGKGLAMESNGDVYSCDHYVYPEYRLGNIAETPIAELAASAFQEKFGRDKSETLPRYCRECRYRFACNGGCPKYRFLETPDGEPGLNYLCAGYRRFFRAVEPSMKKMAGLLDAGRAPAEIMRS